MQSVVVTKEKTLQTAFNILFAISLVHLLNDAMQAVIPAVLPVLKKTMHLSYTQIGFISFTINFTASVMQPVVGYYTDKKPSPYLLTLGMTSTMIGMAGLAFAPTYAFIILSVIMVGLGSAVFHPEGSRVAHMASGGSKGLAQSIYQVGGNAGQALAPVMTALVFVRLGQFGAVWFTIAAAIGIFVLNWIAKWYRSMLGVFIRSLKTVKVRTDDPARSRIVKLSILLLLSFSFARTWYSTCINTYYQFYLQDKFDMSTGRAQIFIFAFLAAGAVGTFCGGPLSDRFGKRNVMLFSLVGSAPFAILLPYVNLTVAFILLLITGFIITSSFSVMVVYAQELVPGKIGLVTGLITGLAFGLGAIAAALLGKLADLWGIETIIIGCSFLPLIGFLVLLLPTDGQIREWNTVTDAPSAG